jgi:hypothetical protein
MTKSVQQKQIQKVHNVSMQCITHLVKNKGVSVKEAEDMIIEILKESASYIQNGNVDFVIATLKMTFLDQSVEQASKDILKSLLK